MSALAMFTMFMEEFQRQIYCKNRLSDRTFYVTIAESDIGSLKSLHTLFDKYLVRTIQYFELFDKIWLTIFDKVMTPFCKTFLCLKQLFDAKTINLKTIIFQFQKKKKKKKKGSPTRVTRLKVALNMADPISLNENRL